jgi:transposase-like protein
MASTTAIDSTTSLRVAGAEGRLLKMDSLGRVRTSKERRQAILDEFERSGVSGAQFAKITGLKYSTLASWVQRQRRPGPKPRKVTAATSRRSVPLRLIEAVVDPMAAPGPSPDQALLLQLPGGARLEMTSAAQVPLVAALVQALQPPAARC